MSVPSVVVGDNVRPTRWRLVAGAPVVVPAGVRLGPAQLGALAAAGVTDVVLAPPSRGRCSSPAPSCAACSDPLGPGEIYDANGFILATQLASAGAEVVRLPAVEDDFAATRDAIERGLAGDVLLTTGGVSVGVHDFVRAPSASSGSRRSSGGSRCVRASRLRSASALDARFRAARESRLVARRVRALRQAGVARAPGRADPSPQFRPGRLGRGAPNGIRDSLLRARSRVADGDRCCSSR